MQSWWNIGHKLYFIYWQINKVFKQTIQTLRRKTPILLGPLKNKMMSYAIISKISLPDWESVSKIVSTSNVVTHIPPDTEEVYLREEILSLRPKSSRQHWTLGRCRSCDRKSRAACAQSLVLWQQATIEFTCHDHSVIACSCHIYVCCYSSRTSRSWWITHLTQRHRRGCNTGSGRPQGGKRAFAPPLQIGTKKEIFLENVQSAV